MNNNYPQTHIQTPHTNERSASVSIYVPFEVCMYIIALALSRSTNAFIDLAFGTSQAKETE